MVSAFESVVKRQDWDKYESRIERNTHRLLEILDESGMAHSAERIGNELTPCASRLTPRGPVRATFFCLGWIAERYPNLIKEIHRQGHEIASHGYDHQVVYKMTPSQFREDIRKSKKILEHIVGEEVIGYRAPSYSITKRSLWSFEILAAEGYRYDSSIFAIHHDFYGFPEAPRFPFIISLNGNGSLEFRLLNLESIMAETHHRNTAAFLNSTTATPQHFISPYASPLVPTGTLIEFPISTVRIFGQNIPISGGGYFRLFPYLLIRQGLKRINEVEKNCIIFYVHPWEFDPDQPRLNSISFKSRFRHYINLDKTESKFKKLLRHFQFAPMRYVINHCSNSNNPTNSTNAIRTINLIIQ